MAVTGVQNNNNVNTNTQANGTKSAEKQNMLDYSAFLNLLLAQLKNQDPTKPMDSTEYMAQLASFSAVEQNVKMNAKLDEMLTLQSLTQAENLVNKNVSNADGSIKGKVTSVKFTSEGPIANLDNGKSLKLGQIITIAP